MEEQELMAALEGIVNDAGKELRHEAANYSLEALEAMFSVWKQDGSIANGQAWFIGLADDNALFPDDLSDAQVMETGAHGLPHAQRMAVRCLATPANAEAFTNMLSDARFVMASHQVLRADGVYGMFTSDHGAIIAIGLDAQGMAFIVENKGTRFAKAYSFGTDEVPDFDAMGMDTQTMEWVSLAMRAYMAPRMLIANSPHMYKAFITGIAAGEQDILDAFGITAEQLLEGLNDI